ncbi:MAG TPA: ferritin family protein [Terriglobia bacterium]|nr:ferritin family protein [Terriglobia bacterium]
MNDRLLSCRYLLLASAFGLGLLISSPIAAAQQRYNHQTLHSLQTAYRAERNAHHRYLAFAQKADQEDYREIANLFRAAARAEEIHMLNHAAVIRGMGGTAASVIEFPVVKSTRENLLRAAKDEDSERETLYPAFIQQAKAEQDQNAAYTFDLARQAEGQHSNLFANALVALANGWEISRTYYVCSVCGYTVDIPVSEHCISCASPPEKYEAVS